MTPTIGSIYFFNYHDFTGLYILTEINAGQGIYYFDSILIAPGCDTDISIVIDTINNYGTLIYAHDKETI
jgi:hypothetical protein